MLKKLFFIPFLFSGISHASDVINISIPIFNHTVSFMKPIDFVVAREQHNQDDYLLELVSNQSNLTNWTENYTLMVHNNASKTPRALLSDLGKQLVKSCPKHYIIYPAEQISVQENSWSATLLCNNVPGRSRSEATEYLVYAKGNSLYTLQYSVRSVAYDSDLKNKLDSGFSLLAPVVIQ